MTIGIVGLGLIGGSFAKAYSDNDEHKVLAYNRSKEVIQAAYNDKAIDGELNSGWLFAIPQKSPTVISPTRLVFA